MSLSPPARTKTVTDISSWLFFIPTPSGGAGKWNANAALPPLPQDGDDNVEVSLLSGGIISRRAALGFSQPIVFMRIAWPSCVQSPVHSTPYLSLGRPFLFYFPRKVGAFVYANG